MSTSIDTFGQQHYSRAIYSFHFCQCKSSNIRLVVESLSLTSNNVFLLIYMYLSRVNSDHDLIGRVSVDVTNFYPGTEYLLTYNIYPTGE